MIRRSFDSDGDYTLNNFIEDTPATIQAVATRLRLFAGEWFLDTSSGVPYYDKILTKPVRLSEVETIIKNRITETDGIDQLSSFSMNFDRTNRSLDVSFTATTTWGDEFTSDQVIGINV